MSAVRESRQFWSVTDYGVKLVTGYSCLPGNDGYWWCPEVGFSMAVGHTLFETEKAAIERALIDTKAVVDRLEKTRATLTERLKEL